MAGELRPKYGLMDHLVACDGTADELRLEHISADADHLHVRRIVHKPVFSRLLLEGIIVVLDA